MSQLWNFARSLRAMDPALFAKLYDEYCIKLDEVNAAEEGYYAFQHWVQIYHRDVYKRTLAYARVTGRV